MTTRGVSRRRTAGLLLGGAAATSFAGRWSRVQTLDKLTYQTGWRAQPQQGGVYQAIATGLYRQHGLEVEVRHAGPQADINTLLLAGRVDFIDSNLFSALNYARENLPGIAVGAIFQKDERVLIAHAGVGNDSLPALKGKPILVSTAGRQSFWQWLKAKYGYTDEQARPYTFSLAPFLADRNMCMQGFVTTEPFALRAAGVDPVSFLLADHGFDNYQGLMMCSPRLVAEKADVVQRFVDATVKGWASYLGGDLASANALIKRDNPEMTDDKIAYSIATMRRYKLVEGGDASRLGVGAMTAERWQSFYKDMVEVGALPADWPSTGCSRCSSSTSTWDCCSPLRLALPDRAGGADVLGTLRRVAAFDRIAVDHRENLLVAARIDQHAGLSVPADRPQDAFRGAALARRRAPKVVALLLVELEAQAHGMNLGLCIAVGVLGMQALAHADGLAGDQPRAEHGNPLVLGRGRRSCRDQEDKAEG